MGWIPLLGDFCGREDFFFYYLSCEGGNFHTFFFQKYVIKCLIMLYIFVFTMGQLLSVYELTVSGERRSVEWFKYRPNFFRWTAGPHAIAWVAWCLNTPMVCTCNIITDPSHPGHNLFALLPSGRQHRSLCTRTSMFEVRKEKYDFSKIYTHCKIFFSISLFLSLQKTFIF